MRLESGQLVQTDKMKLGELYAKWQKKTNRSIGRNGVFDDAPAQGSGEYDRRRGGKGGKSKGGSGDSGDGIKSAMDIKKERAKKQNLKMKNMKKGDRRRAEQQQKQGQGNKGSNNDFSHQKRGKKGKGW